MERILAPLFAGRIGAEHIQGAFESTHEIRQFGPPLLICGQIVSKGLESLTRSSREHKNATTDRVSDLPLLKRAVLHGGEKIAQPAQRPSVQGGVEFVP